MSSIFLHQGVFCLLSVFTAAVHLPEGSKKVKRIEAKPAWRKLRRFCLVPGVPPNPKGGDADFACMGKTGLKGDVLFPVYSLWAVHHNPAHRSVRAGGCRISMYLSTGFRSLPAPACCPSAATRRVISACFLSYSLDKFKYRASASLFSTLSS